LKFFSGANAPDPKLGRGYGAPPRPHPLGAPTLRASARRSGLLPLHRPWGGLSPQISKPSAAYVLTMFTVARFHGRLCQMACDAVSKKSSSGASSSI